MHAVPMPNKSKDMTIKLTPLKPWVRRGHVAHRSGSGTHGDRRLKRLRSRGDQRRQAIVEGSR
jgi:hypothetical protein